MWVRVNPLHLPLEVISSRNLFWEKNKSYLFSLVFPHFLICNVLLVFYSKSQMTCGIWQLIWRDEIRGQSLTRVDTKYTQTHAHIHSESLQTAAVQHTPGSFLHGVPAFHCCLCPSRQQTALVVQDSYSLTCSRSHSLIRLLNISEYSRAIFRVLSVSFPAKMK